MMGSLNLKALRPENVKKKLQDKLKPIIVQKSKQGCTTCGGRK